MPFAWLKKLSQSGSATPEESSATETDSQAANCGTAENEGCSVADHEPLEELSSDKIAQRAYERWVAKGRPEGTADLDWQEAEAELRAEFAREPAEPLPHRSR